LEIIYKKKLLPFASIKVGEEYEDEEN